MCVVCPQAGHRVTVFERNDEVGGLLRYGIPTMKLGKDVSIHVYGELLVKMRAFIIRQWLNGNMQSKISYKYLYFLA